jgi:hypothetical protein
MATAIGSGSAEEAKARGVFENEEVLGKLGRSWWHLRAYYNYRAQVCVGGCGGGVGGVGGSGG